MAMFLLLSGANNSGKSRYGEQWIGKTTGKRYYIATMRPSTPQNYARIEKHRAQRRELGFQTLECPCQVGTASVELDSVVLLEDVSNLLANVLFEQGGNVDSVYQDICTLLDRCRILVAVTIAGLTSEGFEGETAAYIHGLNELNQRLFQRADVAITMQDGVPVLQKGETYDCS